MNDREWQVDVDYPGPLEELADIICHRELHVAFETFDIEWHGDGALLRGRMRNRQPVVVFIPIVTLLALL